MAIEALTGSEDNIHALGATHVAIGPPPGDSRQRGRLDMFPMAILIDRGLRVCSTYGLTIELPDDLRERYAMAVYVPPNASENGKWLVPIPATPLAVPFCALESPAARGCVNRCHSNKGPRYSNKGLQLVSKDIEEDNKRLVLDALDTLFNKRDFEAAERFWSPNYIQHGAYPTRQRGPIQLDSERPRGPALRTQIDFGRRRICHDPRTVFGNGTIAQLDCCRYRPYPQRPSRGALGRAAI
jgi:hypothetical protein